MAIKIIISIILFVAWLLMSLWALLSGRRGAMGGEYLILYASQNGQAEEIAEHSYKSLLAGGKNTGIKALGDVSADDLYAARKIIIIASTTGVGDAPTNAIRFEKEIMAQKHDLSGREYAVLALGDKNYEDFCAFGKRLDKWFSQSGAAAINEIITVDDLARADLEKWEGLLKAIGGGAINEPDEFADFTLNKRLCLNPDADAAKLFALEFKGAHEWCAGDLFEILTPDNHRRDYSIASLASENTIRLYVREVIKDNGVLGIGSGLLTRTLPEGGAIKARIKTHKNFHSPKPAGISLMVAAGSGFAGLRAHILALAAQNEEIHLFYGERTRDKDGELINLAEEMLKNGTIKSLNLALSRDNNAPKYVQDALSLKADAIRQYMAQGGNIIVCGGLDMGLGVDAILRDILGAKRLEQDLASGRYIRDLY